MGNGIRSTVVFCLWILACLPGVSGETAVVAFGADDPVTLVGLRRETFNADKMGDADRLVMTDKGEPAEHAVTASAARLGRETLGAFELDVISHGSAGNIPDRLVASVAADDGAWTAVPLAPHGPAAPLPGGYGRRTFRAAPVLPYEHLKIAFRPTPPGDYWKVQLAELRFDAPPSAARDAEPTVYQRRYPLAFNKDAPVSLARLRRETWQGDRLRLATPRLVLDPKQKADDGTATLDVANLPGVAGFTSLRVRLLTHKALGAPTLERFEAQGSADGRRFVPLALVADGPAEGRPDGYVLHAFRHDGETPHRFLVLRIKGVDPEKSYWKLQIADLELTVDGTASTEPAAAGPPADARRFTSDAPAAGARVSMEIHTQALAALKPVFYADGRETPYRFRDGKADGGGWRRREIVLWGDPPLRELAVLARARPGWGVRNLKVDFIADRAAEQAARAAALPSYAVADAPVKIDALQACFLFDDARTRLDRFPDASWEPVTLTDTGYRDKTWNSLPLLREPGKEVLGALYRFRLAADFDPAREAVRLTLPQSAFVTTIHVDGREAARFTEGFLPLTVDLTDRLAPGRPADILIKVLSHRYAHDEKGKVMFPIGAMAPWTSGLILPPRAERLPATRVDSVFVDPRDGALRLEAELVNGADRPVSATLRWTVRDGEGKTVLEGEPRAATLPPGVSRAEATLPVGDRLKRWDVGRPRLYTAVAELTVDGVARPGFPARFGYRTIEVRGPDLLLNGRKIRLFGPWAHIGEWTHRTSYHGKRLDHRGVYEALMAHGMNAGRLHCQPFNQAFYDAADEAGFLVIAESALAHRPANDAAMTHVRGFVRHLRNHPSIVVWSGSNEFEHWISPRPETTMTFLLDVQKAVKALDPGRPVQHSGFGDAWGELDIHNVHYPAETGNFPKLLYWTRDPEHMPFNRNYRDNFNRYPPVGRKPLAYGEERIPHKNVNTSFWFGEDALRDFYAAGPEAEQRNQRRLARDWALRTRAEREQNVMLVCPNVFYAGLDSEFVRGLGEEFRPAGAYPRFMNPALPAGRTVDLPYARFEDSGFDFSGKTVVRLTRPADDDPAETAAENSPALHESTYRIAGGGLETFTLSVAIPAVARDTPATLTTLTLDADGKTVHRDDTPVKLLAPRAPPPLDAEAWVWGASEAFDRFAARHGLRLRRLERLEDLPDGRPWLVVLPSVPEAALKAKARDLAGRVEKGTRVVLMERLWEGGGLVPGDAVFREGVAEQCAGFVRDAAHPLLAGVDDLDLRCWNDDLTVARSHALKPETGNFDIFVDAGQDLTAALLWGMRHGSGYYLVNHLDLLANFERVPSADAILYALFANLEKTAASSAGLDDGFVVAAPDNDFSAGALYELGWKPAPGPGAKGLTTAVTAEALAAYGVDGVRARVDGFETVVVFNAKADEATRLAKDMGAAVSTKPFARAPGGRLFLLGGEPLYAGLTSDAANWEREPKLPYSFVGASGGAAGGLGLGADAVLDTGRGRLVFLNLPLNRDVPDTARKNRFLARLSTNLGVRLAAREVKNRDLANARFLPVDLGAVANAARATYFAGHAPGGPQTFAGVPFTLPRGSAENPNDFFRFNARQRLTEGFLGFDTFIDRFETKTPERVRLPLPADQAESLYFLHAANRNWKIERFGTAGPTAEYVVHFQDGSVTRVPVQSGRNIADCREGRTFLPKARFAVEWPVPPAGEGERAAVYVFEWENPAPEKKIRALEIVNSHNPPRDLMLFGVTVREPAETFR